MALKIEGKEMYPIFYFAMCCWSVHTSVVRLDKQAHSTQRGWRTSRKTTRTQTLQFHVKFMCTLC